MDPQYESDSLLKELARAHRLSVGAERNTDAQIRYLRRQVIRLAKVCYDLHSRIRALEDIEFHDLPIQGGAGREEVPVTCIAEAV